ncbi:uncharacterized protein LOC121804721 isoform X1 [Salvia splendens]|uniref:uncharacterized protein LOC121804721 isoform X1 n=1 Tax=Salvia splendens TaxID=180675 RepID=UPI001C268298|nr:uncharacterized protein LOC121804721 isoform X1 [Salvia splendens]XP_042060296.1 uncharacterized protein LOC121804721 isoform X1 [Salvia splendens]XP_042060297.1 uncharacterized protein LOC121804721 isoform X1 [Salvia splendens]
MNKSDEDIDLRLALGSRSYSVETRLDSSVCEGAGVNANSRVGMPFTASDPLSELVWSPNNGLSMKCAIPGLANNRPFLALRESTDEILTSQDIRVVSAGEKLTKLDEAGSSGDKAVVFSSSYDGSKGLIDKAITTDAIQQHKGHVHIAESSKMNAEVHTLADAEHDRKSDKAINWKFPSNIVKGGHFNDKGKLEMDACTSVVIGSAVPIRFQPPTAKVSEAVVCSLPNLQAHDQIDDEVTSAVDKTKTDASPSTIPAPTLMNVESSDENDLGGHLIAKEARSLRETELPREDPLAVDIAPTSSRIFLYREKGKEKAKEKALSDGYIYGRSSNNKEDSHETVESCNSAGLFPKGMKRQLYDQEQEIESKRVKTCVEETPGSTSFIKADSSFVRWISNMVNGLSDSNKQESSSLLALTLARSNNVCSRNHQESFLCNKTTEFAKPRTGFQNVFQSLYCQTNKTLISGADKDNQLIAESGELMVSDTKLADKTPQSCNSNNDSSCKEIIISDQESNPQVSTRPVKPWIFSAGFLNRNSSEKSLAESSRKMVEGKPSASLCKKVEKMDLDIPFPVNCVPEKSRPLPSLWITRLYTRTAPFENCNRINDEALDCNSERLEANHESWENDVSSSGKKTRDDCARDQARASESADPKFGHGQSHIQPFKESTNSEEMASVFAKRLDALRNIIHPSGRRSPPTSPLTCFFCGNSGHDIRKCPELTESDLENLLVNISSFNRVDESPTLCIRCFQLNHWAISCPSASSQDNRRLNQNAVTVQQQTTCYQQPFAGEVGCSTKPAVASFPIFLTSNMKEWSSKRLSTSNELQKGTLSNSGNHLKDKQIFPPCKISNTQQEEMFHVIRRLRLSRADILRWMDSDVSLSHLNGFFLRLRLAKLEGGLEGTGYYAACISGDSIENIGCKSNKSVLVDVGGLKSSVGSQYISNQDFLEEEIEGWWSRIVKTGGKIPSLDELKSKFGTRECLGL